MQWDPGCVTNFTKECELERSFHSFLCVQDLWCKKKYLETTHHDYIQFNTILCAYTGDLYKTCDKKYPFFR